MPESTEQALPVRGDSPIVVRPKYELPDDLGPASLADRRSFYRRSMDLRAAARWMDSPKAERVYALILGRHSGIYPRRFRHLKNVPLIVDDARDVRDLRPYLVKYLPEGVYYDRNVYTSLDAARKARLDYARAWRSRFFVGQELAFDLDPENLDCPIHGDIRLIRLPYSLHGMVSRVVVPLPRGDVAKFRYNDPRAVPRF